MKISYEIYERVVRTTIKRSKIFLKRDLKDIRTNAFNEEILRRHRANMDLQFVLDPYACVHYILDYINKSNRGMSRLLKQVIEEQRQGNLTHRQKFNQQQRSISAGSCLHSVVDAVVAFKSRICLYQHR